MIEGALLFAAASVKKLEAAAPGQLVYPFCVRQAGVGYASASAADEQNARCEMWLPLWNRPATLPELRALLGEGRAQVHGRAARDGVDFTRAVVTLGVDRGISEFQRYGFQVRNGLAYFATPLERVAVQPNARADLLSDIDQWLDRFRGKAGGENAPGSVARALRNLEASIVELCKEGSAPRVQCVLIERGLSDTSKLPVSYADFAEFIESDRADRRIEELLWGLNLIDWSAIVDADLPSASTDDDPPPSSLYALLKLCFTRAATDEEPLDPAIHRHAAHDDAETATRLAARRLRASSFPPAVDHVSLRGRLVRRTAAALIFPLRPWQIFQLRRAILRQEKPEPLATNAV